MISNYSQTILKKYSTGEQLCDLLWLLPRPTCGPVQPDAQEGKDFTSSSCCHVAISYQHKIMILYIRRGSTWGSCSMSKCCGLVVDSWFLWTGASKTPRLNDSRGSRTCVSSHKTLIHHHKLFTSWKSCNISDLSWLLTTKSYGLLLISSQLKVSQPLVWTLWAFNCLEKKGTLLSHFSSTRILPFDTWIVFSYL